MSLVLLQLLLLPPPPTMPRAINPTGWEYVSTTTTALPLVSFRSASQHTFSIHPVSDTLVRVVHELPSRQGGVMLRGIEWEVVNHKAWHVSHDETTKRVTIASRASTQLRIEIDYSHYMTLAWHWNEGGEPFLQDFKKGYTYDAVSGRVWHYTRRGQSYIPTTEHTHEESPRYYTYGLGETKGGLDKTGSRYHIDGRDSLAADPTTTDPLYKLCPFYMRHDSHKNFTYGMYYNTLNPSIFDFGAEHDFSTGDFDSFSCEHGPLDYYVIVGSIPSIITQFAHLVTPVHNNNNNNNNNNVWQASETLPPLSQFGYLASSLTLSERQDAQQAVIEYVDQTRQHKFPIDAMHLSSGYCQDEKTQERLYFHWNRTRYPDPPALGRELEQIRNCTVIINVKPWLLESHPSYEEYARKGAFVKAAAVDGNDEDTRGEYGQSRTLHWSSSMGQTAKGSYFDFTSRAGCDAWSELIHNGVLANNITGVWIDNNEYSTLIDDGDVFAGEVGVVRDRTTSFHAVGTRDSTTSFHAGTYGRALQTLEMARSTYTTLLTHSPTLRPTIITRSSVPGMQTYANATWSGDNSTTWTSFKASISLTLSHGLSFGIGLYGQDIGGFAGTNSPSPELLVRWCQQAAWCMRFTVHSWKKISTTLWMYDDMEREGDMDGNVVRKALHDALEWRYALVPMLYSLYVTEYFRFGWPVLRPLLWYHSKDRNTLNQDRQFLLGSHVLVAPVLEYGQRSVIFNLPTTVVDEHEHEQPCWWYDPTTHHWISPHRERTSITLDAPITECPYLLRGGAILVLAGSASANPRTVFDAQRRTTRYITLYPAPMQASLSARKGEFTLVEDDGVTNEATLVGALTEIVVAFRAHDDDVVMFGVRLGQCKGFRGVWTYVVRLPEGDQRGLRWRAGGTADEHLAVEQIGTRTGEVTLRVRVQ